MSHHPVVNVPGTDIWYLYYNRIDLSGYEFWDDYVPSAPTELNGSLVVKFDRRVAYERLEFGENALIKRARTRTQDSFDDGNMDNWTVYTNGIYSGRLGEACGQEQTGHDNVYQLV